jgi:hypothetical protein
MKIAKAGAKEKFCFVKFRYAALYKYPAKDFIDP